MLTLKTKYFSNFILLDSTKPNFDKFCPKNPKFWLNNQNFSPVLSFLTLETKFWHILPEKPFLKQNLTWKPKFWLKNPNFSPILSCMTLKTKCWQILPKKKKNFFYKIWHENQNVVWLNQNLDPKMSFMVKKRHAACDQCQDKKIWKEKCCKI